MIRKSIHAIREMISGLKSSGTFAQNFAITLSGNLVAQTIGFLLTPVIARIYGPEAYGLFALFIGTANALAPFATLQLPSGYPMVKDDERFYALLRSTLLWLFLFAGFVLLLVLFTGHWLSSMFHAPALEPLLFLLPVHLLFTSMDEILLGWSIRLAEFRRGAIGRTLAVLAGKLTTVVLGITVGPRAIGIILGNLLQYPLDTVVKAGSAMRTRLSFLLPLPSFRSLIAVLREHSTYPLFVATGVSLSNLGSQVPVYLLSAFHGGQAAGHFAMAASLVLMPLNLVVNSSAAVFLQKSSQVMRSDPSSLGVLAGKLHNRLFWLGTAALLSFALVSDPLVAWLLGEPWREAGRFAGILAVGSVFTTSSFALSVVYRQLNREHINFTLQVVSLALKTLALFWVISESNIISAVLAYTAVTSLSSLVNLLVIFRLLGQDRTHLLVQSVVGLAALAGTYLLKVT